VLIIKKTRRNDFHCRLKHTTCVVKESKIVVFQLLPQKSGEKHWSTEILVLWEYLPPGARRDGHSSFIFSKTSEWPNLAWVNSLKQFSLLSRLSCFSLNINTKRWPHQYDLQSCNWSRMNAPCFAYTTKALSTIKVPANSMFSFCHGLPRNSNE
jgi:hypothetical protein